MMVIINKRIILGMFYVFLLSFIIEYEQIFILDSLHVNLYLYSECVGSSYVKGGCVLTCHIK